MPQYSYTDLEEKLERAQRERDEALEQQRATAEILGVISSLPADVQPVFDTIVRNFVSLCGGIMGAVYTFDGELVHFAGGYGFSPEQLAGIKAKYPVRSDDRSVISARAILAKEPVHIQDIMCDPAYDHEHASVGAWRRIVAVPMLREGVALGAIVASWAEPGATPKQHEDLLKVFAAQAVIAVENVRLLNELRKSLQQQTATADVLKVISRSTFDLQTVFDTLVESAVRLCEARFGAIFRLDRNLLHLAAQHNFPETHLAVLQQEYPMTPNRGHISGRAVLTGAPVQIPDMLADQEYRGRISKETNFRSLLAVPLLRGGRAIGAIVIYRIEPGTFADKQLLLLQTFADQAVIAIENVRLFDEVQARTRELTETLEQQTATSEVLEVISSSPTQVQPVFEAMVARAAQLCEAHFSAVARLEDGLLHLVALNNLSAEEREAFHSLFPRPPARNFVMGRAFVEGEPVQFEDVLAELGYDLRTREVLQRKLRYRTFMAVPILKDGNPIGVIGCARREVRPFTSGQIGLVKTFADQALIAIENVRLFDEVQTRTKQVQKSLEYQTAISDVLDVISRSPSDVQPVLDRIAETAQRLCDCDQTYIMRLEGERYHVAATSDGDAERMQYLREHPIALDRSSMCGRVALERRTVHINDVLKDPEYTLSMEGNRAGYRTLLGVPLLRHEVAIGVIILVRTAVQPFADKQIELVTTFADQALIAIENVRLFQAEQHRTRELSVALEQQTATSEVLKVISRSTFDLQTVLEALIESATRLCGATRGHIFQFDGEVLRFAAAYGALPGFTDYLEGHPLRPGPGTVAGRAAFEHRTIHLEDVLKDTSYELPELITQQGFRTVLAVPMLREDTLRGVITILKTNVEPFTAKQIELVTTFADQASIAIENVRLFDDVQARTARAEQGTGTADGDLGGSGGHFKLARRVEAGVRGHAGECGAYLRS